MRLDLSAALATLAFAFTCTPDWGQSSAIAQFLYPTPVTVSGVTVDSQGSPVQGVRIEHIYLQYQYATSATTDTGGRFRFETKAPAVVFRRDGFESQLVRVPSAQTELLIVLRAAPAMDAIPTRHACSDCVSVGVFCVPKIKGVQIGKMGGSIDAFERTFSVRTASGRWWMIHGAGPSWGGPNPRDHEVWSSITYRERIRTGDGLRVLDSSGTTSDGKVWRHVGVSGESVFYFDLDPDAASIMDRMLDGLCLNLR